MSLLIKGMDMPTTGVYNCELGVLDENTATLTIYTSIDEPQRSYKLVPVPPHGRLIDADALKAKFKEMGLGDNSLVERLFADGVYAVIDNAPTIIEEEGQAMSESCFNCGSPISKETCEGFPEVCEHWSPKKPITNADRINAMTLEEKAEFLAERRISPSCTGKCHKDYEIYGELRTFCHDCWLDWLKQEADE